MSEKEKIFLSILESHKGIIYKVVNNYCYDKSDQNDLIQEIVLQIWKSIDIFNQNNKWPTWIYKIALNSSISVYRKNKNRKEKTVSLSPIVETTNTFENTFDDEDFMLLRKFIQELKEIDRAFILLHLDGLTSVEVADIMDTTQTNVTTRISRIKKKLKIKFEENKYKNHGKH